MAKIIIIGAGLTGLSAAYHLEEQGFFDYKLFEKEPQIGGLCRSVFQDGFTFDFTGHLLHINDPYFLNLIKKIVGIETFNTVTRKSFIYSNNVYSKYPFQTNLYGLPQNVIADCIEGFVTKPKTIKKTKTYNEWVLQNFGTGFAKHFFFPYQEKIFAYNTEKITSSWTGRFVPSTTLEQIIHGAVTQKTKNVGYNATFLYPKKGGIVSWVQKLANQLINPIQKNYRATKVDLKNKVIHFANGHNEPFEHLINTIPLDTFLEIAQEPSSSSLKKSIKHLECNTVINFNLGINRKNISTKSWIYFPEKQFSFYRIGFPHRFSQQMTPKNCSSLYGEISYLKQNSFKPEILKKAIRQTKKLFKIDDKEVLTKKIITIDHAYVIYNLWREKNLKKLQQQLNSLSVHSIGRYGAWKYSSMQEAILDGKTTTEMILKNIHSQKLIPHQKITQKKDSYETVL